MNSSNDTNVRYSGYLRNVYLKFMDSSQNDEQVVTTIRNRLEEWWSNNIGDGYYYFFTASTLVALLRGPILCSIAVLVLFLVSNNQFIDLHSLIRLLPILILLICGLFLTVLDICQQCQRMYIQCQIFIIRWVDDNLILDTMLLTAVQTMKQLLLGVASIVGMYALPLSQQRRVEVLDTIFPTERFGDQKLSVSEIVTSRGGVLALLPSQYYQDLLLTATRMAASSSNDKDTQLDNILSQQVAAATAEEEGDLLWEGPPFVSTPATMAATGINNNTVYGTDGGNLEKKLSLSQLSIHKSPSLSSSSLNICFSIMKDCMLGLMQNPLFSIVREIKDEVLTKVGTTAFFSLIIHLYSSKFARQTFSRLLHTASLLGFSGALSAALSMVCLKRHIGNDDDKNLQPKDDMLITKVEEEVTAAEEESSNDNNVTSSPSTAVFETKNGDEQQSHQQQGQLDKKSRSSLLSEHNPPLPPKKIFVLLRWIPFYRKISGQYWRSLQVGIALLVLAVIRRRLLLR
jgi:hypothetical protein